MTIPASTASLTTCHIAGSNSAGANSHCLPSGMSASTPAQSCISIRITSPGLESIVVAVALCLLRKEGCRCLRRETQNTVSVVLAHGERHGRCAMIRPLEHVSVWQAPGAQDGRQVFVVEVHGRLDVSVAHALAVCALGQGPIRLDTWVRATVVLQVLEVRCVPRALLHPVRVAVAPVAKRRWRQAPLDAGVLHTTRVLQGAPSPNCDLDVVSWDIDPRDASHVRLLLAGGLLGPGHEVLQLGAQCLEDRMQLDVLLGQVAQRLVDILLAVTIIS